MPESSRCLPPLRARGTRRLLGAALLLGIAACAKPVDAPPVSVVFFTTFSTALDSDAQTVIDRVADDARANPRRRIIVEGYADRTITTPAQNRTLAEQRAKAVTDGLAARGVDPARITNRPRGAAEADPGIESRRVDISFAS